MTKGQERLPLDEEQVRRIFGAIGAAVVVQSADGTITYANSVAEEVLGLSRAEITSRTSADPGWKMILEDGTPVAGEDHPSMVTLRTGGPMRDEVRGLFSDDAERLRWLLISTEPVFEDGSATPAEVISTFSDITALKQAELASRESEERYRQLFEAADDAIFVADAETGMMLDCNSRGEQLIGRSREELRELHQSQLHPPENADHYRREFQRSAETKGLRFNKLEVLHRDGHRTPVEISSGGTITRGQRKIHIGIFRDISQRVARETAQHKRERLLRTMADNYPHYVSLIERGCVIGFSAGQEFRKQGIDPDTFVGLTVEEVFGDHAPVVRAHYEAAFDGEERSFELAIGDQHQHYRVVPLRAEDGSIPRLLAVVENITERKQTLEALQRSEQRFRSYVEHAPYGVFIVDAEGRYLEANPASSAITGYSPEELRGMSIPDLLPADDKAFGAEHFAEVRAKGSASGVGPFVRKDGELRYWSIEAVKLDDDRFLGFVDDVTERRQQQQQLAQADRLSSMGMLAAGVAHEINNPLAYALFNLESLNDDLPPLLEALRRLQLCADGREEAAAAPSPVAQDELLTRFRDALEGCQRIRGVARNLSTFARVEQDDLAPVSLRHVLEAATGMTHNEIKYRARLVEQHHAAPTVLASEGRLCQVFINLLINATHAIDEGARDDNEIVVRSWAEGEQVVAQVSDTGAGIPAKQLQRLFDPFYTTKEVGVGSGLGLTISKSIIDGYGGSIEVESTPGRGTCFTVRLPANTTATAPPSARETPPAEPTARGRLLVVDDEPALRAALAHLLRGHEVVQATSGAEAQALLEADARYDVVLCDVMMPDLCGIDLHQWMVEHHPELAKRLIFITGGAFTPRAREYLAQVDNLMVDKPFDVEPLKRLLLERIEQARG